MEFKDSLKSLRKKANMSQEELANKVGLKKAVICLYESGKRKPSFEALQALADAFNVNISTLTGESETDIDEQRLINYYRIADDAKKAAIIAFCKTIIHHEEETL